MSSAPDVHAARSIRLLALAAFVSGANLRIADPLVPVLAGHFAASVSAAGAVVSGFTLGYALFQIVHGPLGDRIGKLRAVTIGMFIAAVASLACAAAPGLTALTVARFLTGMGAAAVIPLSLAFIGDNVGYERRQLVLGRFMASTLSGQMLGPLVAGALSELLSWRMVFGLMALVFAAVGLLLLPGARGVQAVTSGPRAHPLRQYLELARDPWVRVVVFAVAVEGFLFYGTFAYLGAYLEARFALNYFLIGLIIAGFSIGGIGYSASVKWLVPRLRERGLALGGGIAMLVCFAGIALAPGWLAAVPFFIASGFAFYMLHNTLQTRATEMAPKMRGAGVSFFAFCLFAGQALGAAAFGQGIEVAGYVPVILGAGVALSGIGWWFSRRVARRVGPARSA